MRGSLIPLPMLKDIYFQVGLVGTLAAGALMLMTAMTWFVAVAGTVVRPMSRGRRVAILSLLAVIPPSALLVLFRIVATQADLPRPSAPGR